jgi:hypothetical protein
MPGPSRRPCTRPAKKTVLAPRTGICPATRQEGAGPRTTRKARPAVGVLIARRTLTRRDVRCLVASNALGLPVGRPVRATVAGSKLRRGAGFGATYPRERCGLARLAGAGASSTVTVISAGAGGAGARRVEGEVTTGARRTGGGVGTVGVGAEGVGTVGAGSVGAGTVGVVTVGGGSWAFPGGTSACAAATPPAARTRASSRALNRRRRPPFDRLRLPRYVAGRRSGTLSQRFLTSSVALMPRARWSASEHQSRKRPGRKRASSSRTAPGAAVPTR